MIKIILAWSSSNPLGQRNPLFCSMSQICSLIRTTNCFCFSSNPVSFNFQSHSCFINTINIIIIFIIINSIHCNIFIGNAISTVLKGRKSQIVIVLAAKILNSSIIFCLGTFQLLYFGALVSSN